MAKKAAVLVVYGSDNEVIVCTRENEKKVKKEFFKHRGRTLSDYDRYTSAESGVLVTASMNIKYLKHQ